MKKLLPLIILILNFFLAGAQDLELLSPDRNILLTVHTEEKISFDVAYKNEQVIRNSTISLQVEGIPIMRISPQILEKYVRNTTGILHPVVAAKSSRITEKFNELILKLAGNYSISFRVFNDGVAYRFRTDIDDEIIVKTESFRLNLCNRARALFPEEESLVSHYERYYKSCNIDTLEPEKFCSLPVLLMDDDVNILLTEADVYDYPCMFMMGTGTNALDSKFPAFVTSAEPKPGREDRNQVLESAEYIAKTSGSRDFPWRVLVISENDAALVESNLVYQLSSPLEIENTEWIRPGKVAWDWYNANNIYGVDFESGINTATYKYYIDFASEYGLEYIILDEGWSKSTTEIGESNPDIDLEELIRYAEDKNVGIILWVLWGPLDRNMDILETYREWGIKGIKVDFMQRADQYMVNFYERVAKKAADNQLVVDFHGSFKPSGLRRAYPNVLSYEGVRGNENNKWSSDVTPEHNVTIPFIRMVAGPMDYTPGAMVNATPDNHRVSWPRPMSVGTRCHQVAMYVIYESPLQMLCESPSTYRKEQETTTFISRIPVTWDETKVLDAHVGDYIVIARRHGDQWFLGAMTDGSSREFEVELSFLEEGDYTLEYMQDGPNTDRYAQDYRYGTKEISESTQLQIKLASGGGWAAIISKK